MRLPVKAAALALCAGLAVAASSGSATAGAQSRTARAAADADRMIEPSDFFQDFPEVNWGMSFEDAHKAIERAGARPVRAHRTNVTEMVWTGKFEGMDTRARVHFKEGAGLDDVAVGVYAFEKRQAVFESWLRKLTGRHGAATEESDNEISISKVWRLKNGFVIELRSLKDANSPVVDIHWVRE